MFLQYKFAISTPRNVDVNEINNKLVQLDTDKEKYIKGLTPLKIVIMVIQLMIYLIEVFKYTIVI